MQMRMKRCAYNSSNEAHAGLNNRSMCTRGIRLRGRPEVDRRTDISSIIPPVLRSLFLLQFVTTVQQYDSVRAAHTIAHNIHVHIILHRMTRFAAISLIISSRTISMPRPFVIFIIIITIHTQIRTHLSELFYSGERFMYKKL
jgi:hypothetical protein